MVEHPDAFVPVFNRAGRNRSYNTESCGMHVHMSKNAFTGLHLYKFTRMFYHNPAFILRMSRRKSVRFNQWSKCSLGDESIVKIAKNEQQNYSRYSALNVQRRSTVECRIFRGTLAPAGFYANMEFLHGLYNYTKRMGMEDLSPLKFSIYMRENQKMYPNFRAVLGNRLSINMERED